MRLMWLVLGVLGVLGPWAGTALGECDAFSTFTVRALDPACGGEAGCPVVVDPESLLIVDDGDALDLLTREVGGVAADGVTPLLIEVRSSCAFRVILGYEPSVAYVGSAGAGSAPSGELRVLGGGVVDAIAGASGFAQSGVLPAGVASGIEAAGGVIESEERGGEHVARAVYLAPDWLPRDLVEAGGALEQRIWPFVEIDSDGAGPGAAEWLVRGELGVGVVQPPVMLLHGLWSNGNAFARPTWNAELAQFGGGEGSLLVGFGDYSAGSRVSGSSSRAFDESLPLIEDDIESLLGGARSRSVGGVAGVAVNRIDVIGHSMGGALSRVLASDTREGAFPPGRYRRASNFEQGQIRRLVTINSPLQGSAFADGLLVARDGDSALCELTSFAIDASQGIGPVIEDLSIGKARPAARVKTHVVAGVGGQFLVEDADGRGLDDQNELEDELWLITKLLELTCVDTGLGVFWQCVLQDEHDVIVGFASQLAGASDGAPFTTVFDRVPGSATDTSTHISVKDREGRVSSAAIALLFGAEAGRFVDEIPAWAGDGRTVGACFDDSSPSGGTTTVTVRRATGELIVPGEAVAGGTEIEVQVSTSGVFIPVIVAATAPGTFGQAPTFSNRVDLTLPDNAVGTIEVRGYVVALSGSSRRSEGFAIELTLGEPASAARSVPGVVALSEGLVRQRPAFVLERSDGSEANVLSELTGVSRDPGVAIVDGGEIVAVGDGATIVDFTGAGVTVAVPVAVALSEAGADFVAPIGGADYFDFVAFLDAYESGSGAADLTVPVGVLDPSDISRWQELSVLGGGG